MKTVRASAPGLLSSLALSSALVAQTTQTYPAPTGSVSPSLVVTMNLTGGGTALLDPVVGPNCYLGATCAFPSGYAGTSMTYTLPDGSTANLPNFSGTFFPLGNSAYEISGQASGKDSQNRYVNVDAIQVTMRITCRSGRGGGCSKVYAGGTLTLTVNAPTPTSTSTATPTPTPTPMPPTCFGDCNGDHAVTIDEIVSLVNIAMGADPFTCVAGDVSADDPITVTVAQILTAIDNAIHGCP